MNMMLTALTVLLALIGASNANLPYVFSDGYLDVLGGEPDQSFNCDGRPYG